MGPDPVQDEGVARARGVGAGLCQNPRETVTNSQHVLEEPTGAADAKVVGREVDGDRTRAARAHSEAVAAAETTVRTCGDGYVNHEETRPNCSQF